MSSNEESLDSYQKQIEEGVDEALELAQDARKAGGDPTDHVEIDFADDLAERTEKLLGIEGIQDRIRELEEEHDREELVLELAKEFAAGNIGTSETKEGKLDDAIRTAVAVLTEAIVAAPIEGIDEVVIEENDDGTEYIRIRYAGPIRSAGGTAQALSVLVADYLRQEFDLAPFKPRDDEVERYIEEIRIYESEKSLQYSPSDDEIRTIVRNLPIFIDAEQVTDREVGGYRDLERIEGNRARGGMCLVIAEGTGLKAAKLQKYTRALNLDGWDWLSELPNSADDADEDESEGEDEEENDEPQGQTEFKPKDKFIKDLTGGRPVFSYPQAKGGFRLRYGKARNSGLAASGVNPATMHILDDFIATGTQLKTERPGKAQGMVPVSGCEGPTVKLYNGTVTRIDTLERAKELREQVDEIIDIGEMAVPYGEFLENNHHLPPSPYVHDWWLQDAEESGLDLENLPPEKINAPQAFAFGQKHDIPLHPRYTYLWNDITPEEYKELSQHVHNEENENEGETLHLPEDVKPILEKLLLHHTQPEDETLEIERDHAITLKKVTGPDITLPDDDETETLELVNEASPVTVRDRTTIRIGARMARPEKAKQREQQPAINGLIPVGYEGGNQRDILTSAKSATNNYDLETGEEDKTALPQGTIHADLSQRKCPICEQTTWRNRCPSCDERTEPYAICNKCGTESNIDGTDECPECEHEIKSWSESRFEIGEALQEALENTGARHDQFKTIKGVRGLFSNTKVVEPLEKAILRAKHDLSIYDDGTIRYDMSDIPLTAFKPKETHATLEQLKELGYTEDIHGEPLEEDDQLLELKPQDIIINDDAGETLLDIANFIDELLEAHYGMDPYYNAETKEDIIGELVIGLAPHTSGGVVGRLIGYTKASVGFAHPFFHAAKRRNCFHPDTELTYKHNGEWKNTTIQHLVETHLTENADDSYDDGTIVQHIKDHPDIEELKVPSMTEDGHRTLEPVTTLSKHKPTDKMVTLEFDDGEELTVTPDHKIPVKPDIGDKTFEEKEAKDINQGDTLYDYNEDLLDSVKNYPEIDTLEHLITDNTTINHENVMLRGLDKEDLYNLFTDALKEDWENGEFYKLQSTANYLEMSKKTLSNYLYRDSFPLSILLELYEGNKEALVDEMPRDITLGVKRDNTEMPRFVNLDEELATLLGYYTAEGFTRHTQDDTRGKNATGVRQVDFAATEDQARNFIENTLEKKFNVENPYKENKRITASGTLITYFFDKIVDSGRLAHTKEIPELIKNAANRLKGAYLSGYISGDGYMTNGSEQIGMTTVSKELKNGLYNLFDSLGYDGIYIAEQEPKPLSEKFPDYYDESDESMSRRAYVITLSKTDSTTFVEDYGIHIRRKEKTERGSTTAKIVSVEIDSSELNATYNITVPTTNKIETHNKIVKQCDGDEDSVMLLMDGLLNYSEKYLNHDRRGWSMDRPLVLTRHLDPEEIDDEAHNVEMVERFSKEFYEDTQKGLHPKDVDVLVAEDVLDELGGDVKEGFEFHSSLEVGEYDEGPDNSAYKTLGSMNEKVEGQLELARKVRAVDEDNVAQKVIEDHFIPDLMGNLRSFSQQKVYCNNQSCGEKYRRPPLQGVCRECGMDSVKLSMYEGMVSKYIDAMLEMAEKYELEAYVEQRVREADKKLTSLFEDDTERQTGLGDFV